MQILHRRQIDHIRGLFTWVNSITAAITTYLFLSDLWFHSAAKVVVLIMGAFCVLSAARVVYSLATPHMRFETSRLYLYDQHKFFFRVTVVERFEIRRIVRRAKEIGGVTKLVASDEWLIETSSESHSFSSPYGDKEFTTRLLSFLEQIGPIVDIRTEEEKQQIGSGWKEPRTWKVMTEWVFCPSRSAYLPPSLRWPSISSKICYSKCHLIPHENNHGERS